MIRSFFIAALLLASSLVFADANEGEYLGYKLGEELKVPRGTSGYNHVTGALVYVVPPRRQPHHIDSMSLYVSPKSLKIGSVFGEWYFSSKRSAEDFADRYLAALEEKYGHWKRKGRSLTHGDYQLWVEIEEKPPIVEYWPSQKRSRVAIGLIYAPDSEGREQWMQLIDSELGVADAS